MAKVEQNTRNKRHMTTSVGNSTNSRPKNKSKKLRWKAYRGQGKK